MHVWCPPPPPPSRAREPADLPLPAALWDSLLQAVHCWLQLLHRSSRRLRSEVPSLPLLADQVVLCAWRDQNGGGGGGGAKKIAGDNICIGRLVLSLRGRLLRVAGTAHRACF